MVSRQFLRRPDQEDALRLRRQKDAEEDAMLREERQRRRQQEDPWILRWIQIVDVFSWSKSRVIRNTQTTNPNQQLSVTWWKSWKQCLTHFDWTYGFKRFAICEFRGDYMYFCTTSQGHLVPLCNQAGSGNPFIVGAFLQGIYSPNISELKCQMSRK